MWEFTTQLFSSTGFEPHGHCYLWQSAILWLHVLSDLGIALAYYSIPLALFTFVAKRRDLAYPWMFVLFGAFIWLCGTTHLMNIWTTWHGTYRLEGVLKLLTAGVSVTTAALLWPLIPAAVALPRPAQLAQTNQALQEEKCRLEAANTLLTVTQNQLIESEKLAAIGQLAAKIAHEVNNPLASIKTSLAIVSKRLAPGDRMKDNLQTIEEEIGRIARIMQQLLAVARPASDIVLLQVNEVVQQLLQFVAGELAVRQIESRLEFAEALPPIRMSHDQLKQVLLNLIKNAQDAMPQGGTLRVTTTAQAGGLSLSIADTGSGIAPEHLGRIFEPFFTTKQQGEGMGLGLSVSANIIKSFGGTIAVASQPGQGTVFRVFFPTYDPGEMHTRGQQAALERSQRGRTREGEDHNEEDTHY